MVDVHSYLHTYIYILIYLFIHIIYIYIGARMFFLHMGAIRGTCSGCSFY